jgi:transposase-like protein
VREIEALGYLAVGRKYGVSDNAIRKWRRAYEAERGSGGRVDDGPDARAAPVGPPVDARGPDAAGPGEVSATNGLIATAV